jgi:L-alanine-DL-glutamate epimerase-like enolase superfamily enzyme
MARPATGWRLLRLCQGQRLTVADTTIVRLDTDAGLGGWGECCPLGRSYLAAYPEGIRTGIGVLSVHLLGQDPTHMGAINVLMVRLCRDMAM